MEFPPANSFLSDIYQNVDYIYDIYAHVCPTHACVVHINAKYVHMSDVGNTAKMANVEYIHFPKYTHKWKMNV